MMKLRIITIGAYGLTEDNFFQALQAAHVDTFCDIRQRRGLRGSLYTFANSERLQQKLHDLGIRYLHIKALAPGEATRAMQKQEDKRHGIARRKRSELSQSFIQAYEQECLSNFDSQAFIEQLGDEAQVVALFCVEGQPDACHRSLVAKKLAQDTGLEVEHILPQSI